MNNPDHIKKDEVIIEDKKTQLDRNKLPQGLVICSSCEKIVPNALVCVYCGTPIKRELTIPALKPLEIKILNAMQLLSIELKVSDINKETNISRESIRVCLSGMLRFGLVNKAGRGKYTISKIGESKLKDSLQGVE